MRTVDEIEAEIFQLESQIEDLRDERNEVESSYINDLDVEIALDERDRADDINRSMGI